MSDVDEIKQRIDIVDLISQNVALKRAGRTYMALCPFHSEKTPSFHVDPARQSWHCFGACGTGGDIFSFVMKRDGCDFREALRTLAERAGVSLEQRGSSVDDARRSRLFDVTEAAAAWYHASLTSEEGSNGRAAGVAREYLQERRVAAHSIEAFQIGYAPNAWDGLLSHLAQRGFTAHDVIAAGLAIEGDRGAYDRFRHRLMFPIRDERGRVAGFGGRLLPGEALGAGGSQPKYVNTSQSVIFDKSAILYGLDIAKDAIRSEGRAVIVEGYMDAIAAHEHGFANVVASMGTAVTERQVAILKRYTRNLVLALDADAAGSEGNLRGYDAIYEAGDHAQVPVPNWRGVIRMQETLAADVRVVVMPEGRDPDDVIRTDTESWRALVDGAVPFLDFRFDVVIAKHDLSSPRERSAVAAELAPMIAAIPDRVVQSHYVQRLARLARVDEPTIGLELKQPATRAGRERANTEAAPNASRTSRDRKEEFCLALLFRYPVARDEGMGLDPNLFGHSENRALFESWIGWQDTGEPFEASLATDLHPHYERLLSIDLPTFDDDAAVRALHSSVWSIEQERLRTAKRVSGAVLAELVSDDSGRVAEAALQAWESGDAEVTVIMEDEADPAAAFVEDMEAGLKVHQRILEQRRSTQRPAR